MEIRQAYVETMGKMYLHLFKQYLTNMKKLLEAGQLNMDKTDLLGTDSAKTGGLFTSRRTDEQLLGFFSLRDRYALRIH